LTSVGGLFVFKQYFGKIKDFFRNSSSKARDLQVEEGE